MQTVEQLSLYTVTEKRPHELARLLHSLALSTIVPSNIAIITPNTAIQELFAVHYGVHLLRQRGCTVHFVACLEEQGLAARKNIGLEYAQLFETPIALSSDDDFVFDFYALENLLRGLLSNNDIFAVGPMMREYGNIGLPQTPETWDETFAHVDENGSWCWGGYRQGVQAADLPPIVNVQHLAGCYMHRVSHDITYDIEYDRPVYFLHESDFVYGKPLAIVTSAICHHWRNGKTNLRDLYTEHKENILHNVQYFAKKYNMGTVKELSWDNFIIPQKKEEEISV